MNCCQCCCGCYRRYIYENVSIEDRILMKLGIGDGAIRNRFLKMVSTEPMARAMFEQLKQDERMLMQHY